MEQAIVMGELPKSGQGFNVIEEEVHQTAKHLPDKVNVFDIYVGS